MAIAHRDLVLFDALLEHLDEVTTALLCQGWNGQADDPSIAGRSEPEIRLKDRLLNRRDDRSIPGLNDQKARLGGRDRRKLWNWGGGSVVFDPNSIQESR